MFDNLQDRIARTIKNLRGHGKLTEENMSEAIEDVRSSLLEADVQYRVVQSVIDSIRTKVLGEEVLLGVDPQQQFIKFLADELNRILGGEAAAINLPTPARILMVGLQGSGKTTTTAKLAKYFRDEKKRMPFLVPADTSRPAAREQLEILAKQNGFKVFESREGNAVDVCKKAMNMVAQREVAADLMIFDTAGRLAIDETLMDELKKVHETVKPHLVLYVLDSMAGQDAVNTAQTFQEKIGFDGVILTKMDGDARGGSALSVKVVTGKPIYFMGVSEKVDGIEPFYPERLTGRLLGMGDVLSLVEKAQKVVDEKKAEELAKKLRKNQFTIEDFGDQLQSLQKMGSMGDLIGMLPGAGQLKKAMAGGLPEKEIKKTQAIIQSMTAHERRNHQILNGSRRLRIAKGSGTSVNDVNRFLKQFLQTRTMMSQFQKLGVKGMKRGGFFG
jgi:signal recognition particle subunit SRP54